MTVSIYIYYMSMHAHAQRICCFLMEQSSYTSAISRQSSIVDRQLTLVAVAHAALHLSLIGFRPLREAKDHPRRGQGGLDRRPCRRHNRVHHLRPPTHGRPQRRLVGVPQLQQLQVRPADAVVPPGAGGAVASRHGLVAVALVADEAGGALAVAVAVGLAPSQRGGGVVEVAGDVGQLAFAVVVVFVVFGVGGAIADAVVDVGPIAPSPAGAARDGRPAGALEAGQAGIAVGVGIAISLPRSEDDPSTYYMYMHV